MTREKWAKLSPEEQRIRVAELCGGRFSGCRCGRCTADYELWHWPDGRISDEPPNYLNNLNACHGMEQMLDEAQDHPITYWEALMEIVGCTDSNDGNEMRKVICATAAQRCEAFVLTMEEE